MCYLWRRSKAWNYPPTVGFLLQKCDFLSQGWIAHQWTEFYEECLNQLLYEKQHQTTRVLTKQVDSKLKTLWWIIFTQWASFRNEVLLYHALWMKRAKVNANIRHQFCCSTWFNIWSQTLFSLPQTHNKMSCSSNQLISATMRLTSANVYYISGYFYLAQLMPFYHNYHINVFDWPKPWYNRRSSN